MQAEILTYLWMNILSNFSKVGRGVYVSTPKHFDSTVQVKLRSTMHQTTDKMSLKC